MEPTLLQKVVEELSCPGCSIQTSPPLLQCTAGHISCSECSEKNMYCPDCQPSENKKRNYALERLCFTIKVNCSFAASNGCGFTGTGIDVALHEKKCTLEDKSDTDSAGPEEEPCMPSELSSDTNHSLDNAILAELECPVCKVYTSPPIVGCENGHTFCNDCFQRLDQCPVCRGSKSDWKNIIMERLFHLVVMPCKYAHTGCEIREKGLAIVEHENSCRFAPWSCPLSLDGTCRWHGLEEDVVDHCTSSHPDRFHLKSAVGWNIRYFFSHRLYFSVFYFEGVLFRCGFQKYANKVTFNVNYLGTKLSDGRFSYELKVLEKNSVKVWITKGDYCSHVPNDRHDFIKVSSIRVGIRYLHKCLDDEGGLRFAVKIIDNSKSPRRRP